jgi:hypothetical protein
LNKNYYSEWIAPDADNDGYVNSPYFIAGESSNRDEHPLAYPSNEVPDWYEYTPPPVETSGETSITTTLNSNATTVNVFTVDPMMSIAIGMVVAVILIVALVGWKQYR